LRRASQQGEANSNADYRCDADSDVLADYVLALLRHSGSIEEVRKLCEAEMPDFLQDGSNTLLALSSVTQLADSHDLPQAPPHS
jgi:RNA-binding protein 26